MACEDLGSFGGFFFPVVSSFLWGDDKGKAPKAIEALWDERKWNLKSETSKPLLVALLKKNKRTSNPENSLKTNNFEGIRSSFFLVGAKEIYDLMIFPATFWCARDLEEVRIGFSKPTLLKFKSWQRLKLPLSSVLQCCSRIQGSSRKYTWKTWQKTTLKDDLGGGFTYFFIFHPKNGEMIQFDLRRFFQLTWFNHHLVIYSLFGICKSLTKWENSSSVYWHGKIRTVYFFKTVSRSNRSMVRMIDINLLNE